MLQREGRARAASLSIEVEAQTIELLPTRTALGGLIDITTVVPVNIAIAVNAATIHSTAAAHAWQGAFVH